MAGCATGEEAFSIAISLQEYLSETGAAFPVQIFASDISLPAIEKARTGRYLENIAADVTHERLNRYFTKIEGGYQINKNLREMCVFTRHNLIDDPPFSKLDLISCRNVLIYLGSVQKNILPLFHYALKPAGFLMLGASEAAASGDLFSVVEREHRIYAKRETARKPHLFHAGRPRLTPGPAGGRRRAGAGCGIVGRRRRAERGGSHPPVEVQPGRCGGGRRPGGPRDPRQGQPLPHAAGGKGELQSHEADSRHRIVSGSREADPAGAEERRTGAAGARALRT